MLISAIGTACPDVQGENMFRLDVQAEDIHVQPRSPRIGDCRPRRDSVHVSVARRAPNGRGERVKRVSPPPHLLSSLARTGATNRARTEGPVHLPPNARDMDRLTLLTSSARFLGAGGATATF